MSRIYNSGLNPEQIRGAISATFEGRDFLRVWYLTLWWLHGFTNIWSERIKLLLPWPVTLIGTDRNPFRLRWRKRPLGYWLAKIVTLFMLGIVFSLLGVVGVVILVGFVWPIVSIFS